MSDLNDQKQKDFDAIWYNLSWQQHERARKEIRRQKIEHVCKWITIVTCVVLALVLFLVWLRP